MSHKPVQKLSRHLLSSFQMAGVTFILSMFIAGLFQAAYFRVMPGSWFLTSGQATAQSSEVGQPVPFEWCRSPRRGAIQAEITRTFYILDQHADFKPISEYTFKATIEEIETDCQPLGISVMRQPQVQGTYYFVTDLRWEERGETKKLQYRVNNYNYSPAP